MGRKLARSNSLKLARIIGLGSTGVSWFAFATSVFAQTATSSPKGGTSGALPDAGSTELTYLIFLGGVVLFVIGTIKLIVSYKSR